MNRTELLERLLKTRKIQEEARAELAGDAEAEVTQQNGPPTMPSQLIGSVAFQLAVTETTSAIEDIYRTSDLTDAELEQLVTFAESSLGKRSQELRVKAGQILIQHRLHHAESVGKWVRYWTLTQLTRTIVYAITRAKPELNNVDALALALDIVEHNPCLPMTLEAKEKEDLSSAAKEGWEKARAAAGDTKTGGDLPESGFVANKRSVCAGKSDWNVAPHS